METLALIELLDREGLPQRSVRVTQWPVRIGRAIDCDVVIDDPHVAAHHATLVQDEGGVHVVPAPSVNGVRFGRSQVVAGSSPALPPNGMLTLGATTVRVRLAGEALSAEVPLATERAQSRRAAWLLGLGVFAAAWAAFQQWLNAAPGASGTEMAVLFLAAPVVLGLWCGLWALGSKLFQHQFAFWPHLEVALFWPLVAVVANAIAGQLAFALSEPMIAKVGRIVAVGAIAMLLWRHLGIVLPRRRREIGLVMLALVVIGGGLDVAERIRLQQPLVGELYLSTLSLPQVRVAHPVSAETFVKSAQPLEDSLARWAKAPGSDSDPADDEDDEDD
jgi:pSer/pThr/pTyr-binding forkhead associated (FHA) protein